MFFWERKVPKKIIQGENKNMAQGKSSKQAGRNNQNCSVIPSLPKCKAH